MHGPYWWREISKDNTSKNWAPRGKVKPGGRAEYLLQKYPNVFGDLSANSGYNAVSRDEEYGMKFLEKNCHKLLFGTDILMPGMETPMVDFIRKASISRKAFELITYRNAEHILSI